jgi:hypothetical protein
MPATAVNFGSNKPAPSSGVSSKELQNLVQAKVIYPRRKDNLYWFDRRVLLEVKMALYLKESLGFPSKFLSHFDGAPSRSIAAEGPGTRRFVSLQPVPQRGQYPIESRIPLGSLAREGAEQMPQAEAQKDLQRRRRRAG